MGFKEDNEKERLKFVDLWSKFVKENKDNVWSRQQNKIINSCLRSANISKELFLRLKKEKFK